MSTSGPRPAQPAGRRLNLSPHAIAVLLVASIFLPSGFDAVPFLSSEETHAETAECEILEDFLGSPELVEGFEGTPAELQRWVDLYDRDCR